MSDAAHTPAPADTPAPELYKIRIVCGANLIHVVARHKPTSLPMTGEGMVDVSPWEPLDGSTSDQIVFLKASAVDGLIFRRAVTAREQARALGEPLPIDDGPERAPA